MKYLIFILMLCLAVGVKAETGIASWYSVESCQREGTSGVKTASGAVFSNEAMSCALPHRNFGKWYIVTNLSNNKSVKVKHTDFGPNKKLVAQGRIIDLSKGSFAKIADLKDGLCRVKVEEVE